MQDKQLLEAALGGLEYHKSQIEDKITLIKTYLGHGNSSSPAKVVKKRRMSAEARARIGAATKKRWAERRKQQKKKG
jgi:hypothetical protein